MRLSSPGPIQTGIRLSSSDRESFGRYGKTGSHREGSRNIGGRLGPNCPSAEKDAERRAQDGETAGLGHVGDGLRRDHGSAVEAAGLAGDATATRGERVDGARWEEVSDNIGGRTNREVVEEVRIPYRGIDRELA